MPQSRNRRKKPARPPGQSGKRGRPIGYAIAAIALAGTFAWYWNSSQGHRHFNELAEHGHDALDHVQSHHNLGRDHVDPGTAVRYEDDIPTSGTHSRTWTEPGVYDHPQPKPELVHALEHGNIVIYYDRPTAAARELLEEWAGLYRGQWDGIVVTPKSGLGEAVVLTAWVKTLRLDKWNAGAAAAFIDAYRGRGPENPVR